MKKERERERGREREREIGRERFTETDKQRGRGGDYITFSALVYVNRTSR